MIVSNATPLIYLAKVGKLELLKEIFGEVYIPEEVKIETVDKGKELKRGDASIVEKAIGDGWLKVSKTRALKIPVELEKGEIAAISLAKNLGVEEVLIDEISARTAARLLGLKPRGTIFVLLRALRGGRLGLNDFVEVLEGLVRQGFRLREEVYLEAIKEARRISKV